jgi:hypothetical protein
MVVITGQVVSQSEQASPEEQMMQVWMKHVEPGKFHAHLEPLVGQWRQTFKWWMAPGAPPKVSTGTCEYKWIMGKRFILKEVKGDVEDQTFEGMGMMGYDNFKKKYTGAWIDSMTTAIETSMGTCDDSGKVFTMIGRHDDVFTGKADQKFRSVIRIVNNDMHVGERYVNGSDGKEFKTLEITYTRK